MKEMTCAAMGLPQCVFVARADAAGVVVAQMVEHLRTAHGIALPDVDTILQGKEDVTHLGKGEQLVIQRLREGLNLDPETLSPQMGPIALGPPGSAA